MTVTVTVEVAELVGRGFCAKTTAGLNDQTAAANNVAPRIVKSEVLRLGEVEV
jgi:hypothetical protein